MSDKPKGTSRRQVAIGHETYINQKTGELIECQVVEVEDRDFNFDKVWVWWLAQALDLIGNAKVKVLAYMIENRDRENRIIKTQRALADEIGVSLSTISSTLIALQEVDAIRSPQSGVYTINPEFLFKGRHNARMRVMLDYKDIGKIEESQSEAIAAAE